MLSTECNTGQCTWRADLLPPMSNAKLKPAAAMKVKQKIICPRPQRHSSELTGRCNSGFCSVLTRVYTCARLHIVPSFFEQPAERKRKMHIVPGTPNYQCGESFAPTHCYSPTLLHLCLCHSLRSVWHTHSMLRNGSSTSQVAGTARTEEYAEIISGLLVTLFFFVHDWLFLAVNQNPSSAPHRESTP